jgi:hypothetical protein
MGRGHLGHYWPVVLTLPRNRGVIGSISCTIRWPRDFVLWRSLYRVNVTVRWRAACRARMYWRVVRCMGADGSEALADGSEALNARS